ncbi:Nuclear pore complex glycoprotein subunit [Komagataella phaffii CBS 7435]|uniref:Nuclear pore membrane glycoprotein n=2 Tax=Komagataella phaffii TaxID=460519 RepID=C4R5C9_KOMPG|nr:Nuclear pore membrane glycoprotein [Komagataella phaffii GS115]AOA63491.1 GQ67_03807T0 [Komagataella phaffii]CAH2449455.1 Nuclear pore complex glycoprotein subunit [Komagataella phaffii CBS 7435]AOA69043.1 GQ68_03780T0 [Komagataella phaffii GS115]CAY70765.1 Nuclear pore membrane glycoprotein [Komagataella phaffii GS115]CCA39442.1 Nuclear pore complex glycoprotein subunit [Komagataella phaffii CBS 7435]
MDFGSQRRRHRSVQRALVPEYILDVGSQRLFMISLFGLIQAWKVYDIMILKNESLRELLSKDSWISFSIPELNFVVKYLVLDGLFLWCLPVLKIPLLNFSILTTLIQITLMAAITILLSSDMSMPLAGILMSFWNLFFPKKELALLEDYIPTAEFEDQSPHLKGRTTIKYLPDSSAKLNPFYESHCMTNIYTDKIQMPIRFNSTSNLEFVQLEYRSFSNEVSYLNYTKKDLRRMLNRDSTELFKKEYAFNGNLYHSYRDDSNVISFIEVPLTQPGLYSLHQVYDSKLKRVRIAKNEVFIVSCPSAQLYNTKPDEHYCVGENQEVSAKIFGVPPLKVVYHAEIGNKLLNTNSVDIIDEDVESPLTKLQGLELKEQALKISTSIDKRKSLEWARTKSFTAPLSRGKIDEAGSYIYTLHQVIDGFGNRINYVPEVANNNLFYQFEAHPIIKGDLEEKDKKLVILQGSPKELLVSLDVSNAKKEAPYTVEIEFTSEDKKTKDIITKVFEASQVTRNKLPFQVKSPGTYTLKSIRSKFCQGEVGPSILTVTEAFAPSLNISSNPILDACIGTTGYKFDLQFLGTPPFEVDYKVYRLDSQNPNRVLTTKDVSTIIAKSNNEVFNYEPNTEGTYAIEFIGIRDKYYKKLPRLEKGKHRYTTYLKQRTRAGFVQDRKLQDVCNGDSASVLIKFDGKPPYKVNYEISDPLNQSQNFTVDSIMDNEYRIEMKDLLQGGTYNIKLLDVKDESNCNVVFQKSHAQVNVRKHKPHLQFGNAGKFELVEGQSLNIPLKSDTEKSISLHYTITDPNNPSLVKHTRISSLNPNKGLSVKSQGIYRLVGFNESVCPGIISSDSEVEISYKKKPSLKLLPSEDTIVGDNTNSWKLKPFCQGKKGYLDLLLEGEAPFFIEYAIKHPGGFLESKLDTTSRKKFSISLRSDIGGDYVYTILGIYDSVYFKSAIKELEKQSAYKFEPVLIDHHVYPLPDAHFITDRDAPEHHNPHLQADKKFSSFRRSSIYQTCLSNLNKRSLLRPLSISLSGQAPFQLKLKLFHEKSNTEEFVYLSDLPHEVEYYDIYSNLDIGNHVVSIVEVTDSGRCKQSDFTEHEMVAIHVNDIPKIEQISTISKDSKSLREDELEYCVGDQVAYSLSGVPPFKISYEFDGISQVAEVNKKTFKRRAYRPGKLTIASISDSSSKDCLVQLQDRADLEAVIYDIPSVEMTTGDSYLEGIHEGDKVELIFKLTGSPPFTLKYVRTDLKGKHANKEVIENIMDHEVRVWANMEGNYEPIEIQDAHCKAEKKVY